MATFGDLMVDQFFRTNVTSAIAVGATTINVADSSGFPTPTGNKYFYLTLVNENDVAEVVKIANVTGLTLTLVAGDAVQNGFAATVTRAELWFTAEAFIDMQDYILSLIPGGGGGYEPDEVALTLNGLNELTLKDFAITGDGVKTSHIGDEQIIARTIKNGEVSGIKLANDAVSELKILNGAVTTNKIQDGNVTLVKLEPIDSGGALGNLTGAPLPPYIIPIQEGYLSNDMGGDLPGTEQNLTNQRAVYNFVTDEIADNNTTVVDAKIAMAAMAPLEPEMASGTLTLHEYVPAQTTINTTYTFNVADFVRNTGIYSRPVGPLTAVQVYVRGKVAGSVSGYCRWYIINGDAEESLILESLPSGSAGKDINTTVWVPIYPDMTTFSIRLSIKGYGSPYQSYAWYDINFGRYSPVV